MKRRVVITGLGVVAPNANGIAAFDTALRATRSGLRTVDFMVKHGFACTVGGIPRGVDELAKTLFTEEELMSIPKSGGAFGLKMSRSNANFPLSYARLGAIHIIYVKC